MLPSNKLSDRGYFISQPTTDIDTPAERVQSQPSTAQGYLQQPSTSEIPDITIRQRVLAPTTSEQHMNATNPDIDSQLQNCLEEFNNLMCSVISGEVVVNPDDVIEKVRNQLSHDLSTQQNARERTEDAVEIIITKTKECVETMVEELNNLQIAYNSKLKTLLDNTGKLIIKDKYISQSYDNSYAAVLLLNRQERVDTLFTAHGNHLKKTKTAIEKGSILQNQKKTLVDFMKKELLSDDNEILGSLKNRILKDMPIDQSVKTIMQIWDAGDAMGGHIRQGGGRIPGYSVTFVTSKKVIEAVKKELKNKGINIQQ
ncbi:hypothetical protein [Endozoicomonas ascidiicola]|uniref:hypothetical protein n=1 Tax=Endozoicomonas ascidiicola TaxID=1698521 RepID=UPI00083350F9|nr:hypothetical protein [Endozoicomonas ascidiicola]